MNTIDDFLALVETELGLGVTPEQATHSFDDLPGWDSVHVLSLISAVERETGHSISLARVLEASNLAEIYALAVPA